MTPPLFWKSSGIHLTRRTPEGWLAVTPDFLRAYYTRPEIHPIETSCAAEHALFERLMDDPFCAVTEADITAIEDPDARDNYKIILNFRDLLTGSGSIEGAYMALFDGRPITVPPVFIDQMVHLVLANILADEKDPMILRAAEIMFRPQIVTLGKETVMLADAEVVAARARDAAIPNLTGGPVTRGQREAEIDILTEETKQAYWLRSDKFDTAVDFGFTQPASDGLAMVMTAWIRHFVKVDTRISSVKRIQDDRWSWHIGCDAASTRILNALYDGQTLPDETLSQILGLYRLEFDDPADTLDSLGDKPVYLGVAMDTVATVTFKPQNLLTNLPIRRA